MTYNFRVILRIISVVLFFEGTAMLIPICYGVYQNENSAASALFFTAVCCIGFGAFVYRHLKYYTLRIKARESFFVAFICWFLVCAAGTFPYLMAGEGYSAADSIFESVSGWTTTGAWAVPTTQMPRCLVLWKAITNWLGGMGLLLLTVTFFPILGAQGQKMASAEVPGIEMEKMSARLSDTGKLTYRIYIAMSVLELLLLLPSMSPFDAAVNTMSTISTAGILNVHEGIPILASTPYVKTIFTIFSIAGSVNFVMYFFLYNRKWKKALHLVEVKTYLGLVAGGSLLIGIILYFSGNHETLAGALGDSFAQAAAFASTSGYEVDDINVWPTTCKMILLALLFIGGCANSTSGSVKVIRFIIYFKIILRGIYKRIHPKAIKPIMLKGKPVSAATASSVTVFMLLFFAVFIFSSLILALENYDLETTFSAVLGSLTNNGTAFGLITGGNYSIFSSFGKLYCAALMIAGRLEIYPIIILFSRSFWNSDRARS